MDLTIIVTLITTFANVVLTVLSSKGVITPSMQGMIGSLTASGAALFSALKSGSNPSTILTDVATTLQSDLAIVEQDTAVDPVIVSQIQEAMKMLKAAIAGYEDAQVTTDPSTLTQLPE